MNQKYSNKTKNLMRNILTVESQNEIQNLLNQITLSSEDGVKASLNHCYSQIDITKWNIIGETTNAAESAHADINSQKFDNRKFITCTIQDRYGVTKTGRNNGPIAKAAQSIKRHDKKRTSKKQLTNKNKCSKSISNESNEEDSLTQLESQISLEERQLELEE
ncbi:13208_t:CDS:2 [Gigaspora margarita]|uniref:13208_t:CDS:1 n=1 Tax=Gigaspora margarita TaxID=4874 RepID=A0ABN7W4X5_GIGMA|nr:13208_t:CDS:2 [Gigaspora margarita]